MAFIWYQDWYLLYIMQSEEAETGMKSKLRFYILWLQTVYDKDTFTKDDKMGQAEIDIRPYLECIEMRLMNLPTPTTIRRIYPAKDNYLADESNIMWENGKVVQDLTVRLRNVETGEVELQLYWIDLPGSKWVWLINWVPLRVWASC